MEYKNLSDKDKKTVYEDWDRMSNDKQFDCHIHCRTVEAFFENHQEMDYKEMIL